jgi:hypothetical protein
VARGAEQERNERPHAALPEPELCRLWQARIQLKQPSDPLVSEYQPYFSVPSLASLFILASGPAEKTVR